MVSENWWNNFFFFNLKKFPFTVVANHMGESKYYVHLNAMPFNPFQ